MTEANQVLWRRLRYFLSPQLSLYEQIAPHVAGLDVLEVGFGTGIGAVQLAERAARVVAIEVDGDAVAFAREVFPLVNVNWEQGDIQTLRWHSGFDAVVMVEVLEHVPTWQAALDNVRHLLKPGGVLYASARNANADLRTNNLHEREWSADEFLSALEAHFDAKLYDWRLAVEQTVSTRQTPLVAVARKP